MTVWLELLTQNNRPEKKARCQSQKKQPGNSNGQELDKGPCSEGPSVYVALKEVTVPHTLGLITIQLDSDLLP